MDIQFKERYSIVVNRVRVLDNPFFYGVKSTGIYCLPHCPSKLPKPENVEFFDSTSEASRNGFRPCKRCRPNTGESLPVEDDHLAIYRKAIQLIREQEVFTVNELAKTLNISQKQLNRILRKTSGQTAKELLRSSIH